MPNVNYSSNIKLQTEPVTFTTAKEFIYSQEFHIMLHGFCEQVMEDDKELKHLIDNCFTERGSGEDDSEIYIDRWKISRLLMDIYNNDFSEYKNIHANEHNKFYFKRFLGAFYNYFFNEYKPFLIEVNEFLFTINAIIKICEKQHLLNLVMETYSIILKNLEKYENAMDIS